MKYTEVILITKLYEDHLISISLAENPVAVGHIVVEPKEKFPDMQSMSDELVQHLFFGASYAATALFELANAQGTNIILEEHDVRINVVARSQDDGLNFLWEPKQANPQELQSIAKSIKDKVDINEWAKNNPKGSTVQKKVEVIESTDDKPNFLLKSLERVP